MDIVRSRREALPASRVTRAVAVVTLILLAMSALSWAGPAQARTLTGVFTSIVSSTSEMPTGGAARLDAEWTIPAGATAGDTFTLTLPAELTATSTAPFDVTAPDGSVVAHVVWSGQRATFTLTDYVDTHSGTKGSAFFSVSWSASVDPTQNRQYVLAFAEIPNTVTIDHPADAAGGTEQSFGKTGIWADRSEGSVSPAGALVWGIFLPTGPAQGIPAPLTVVDTPGPGHTVDCNAVVGWQREYLEGGVPDTTRFPTQRYTVSCTPTRLEITVRGVQPGDPAVYPGENIYFSLRTSIVDAALTTYQNTASMTAGGVTTPGDVYTVRRTSAGGEGVGAISVTVGDLVWRDLNSNGIQDPGEPGIPGVMLEILDENGNPAHDINGDEIPPETTDANGLYSFTGLRALPAGQHYTVVVQRTASADALAGLIPTYAGIGGNRATDSSTWEAESTDLTANGQRDDTLDFGFRAAPPPPPPPPTPTTSTTSTTTTTTTSPPPTGPTTTTTTTSPTTATGPTTTTTTPRPPVTPGDRLPSQPPDPAGADPADGTGAPAGTRPGADRTVLPYTGPATSTPALLGAALGLTGAGAFLIGVGRRGSRR